LVWLCRFQVTILGRQLLALLSSTVQAEADGSTQSMKATVELDAARSGLHIALTETQTLHVVVDKRSGRSTAYHPIQPMFPWVPLVRAVTTRDWSLITCPARSFVLFGRFVLCSFLAEGDVPAVLLRELEQCLNSALAAPVTVDVFARLRCASTGKLHQAMQASSVDLTLCD
jgi:hypothetical protein